MLKHLSGLVIAASVAVSPLAYSQEAYPEKPITMVVGFPVGGSADQFARIVSNEMNSRLGVPVVVENRSGANALIGTSQVARAPADGYTILAALGNHTVNPALYKNINFDSVEDFRGIGTIALSPNVIVAHPDFPAADLNELIQVLKDNPGRYTYASSGSGGTPHLAGEIFKKEAGVELLHVPYRGAAAALTDVIGGTVDLSFATLASAVSQIESGRLKAYAVMHDTRVSQFPDLPSTAEHGLDTAVSTWYGLLVPRDTPNEIVRKLESELKEISETPAVKQQLVNVLASTGFYEDGEHLDARLKNEVDFWIEFVSQTEITLEQ